MSSLQPAHGAPIAQLLTALAAPQAGAESPKKIELQVAQHAMELAPSNKSAIEPADGSHLIAVRTQNGLGEFSPELQDALRRELLLVLLSKDFSVICFGENLPGARNSNNPHPHLHIIASRGKEEQLPAQWRDPATGSFVPAGITVTSIPAKIEAWARNVMDAVIAQRKEAATIIGDATDARIIQRIVRTEANQFRIETFVYQGINETSLPRLIEKRPVAS